MSTSTESMSAVGAPSALPAGPVVLYIGGWGRSGSTLADLLAGRLDGFVSVGEVRELFFRGVIEDRRCGCGATFSTCPFWAEVGLRAFGGWDRAAAERIWADLRTVDRGWTTPMLLIGRATPSFGAARDRLLPVLQSLYAAIADVAGARVVVDSSKLPNYAALLGAASIDVRIAHLVRDPRGVMHSWQKSVTRADASDAGVSGSFGGDDQMVRYSTVAGSLRYVMYNSLTQLLPRRRFPYLRVRYEDLVRDPRHALAQLADLASEPGATRDVPWLHDGHADIGVVHTVDGNPMRLNGSRLALRTDDAWRTELGGRQRLAIAAITAPLLAAYGYARRRRRRS